MRRVRGNIGRKVASSLKGLVRNACPRAYCMPSCVLHALVCTACPRVYCMLSCVQHIMVCITCSGHGVYTVVTWLQYMKCQKWLLDCNTCRGHVTCNSCRCYVRDCNTNRSHVTAIHAVVTWQQYMSWTRDYNTCRGHVTCNVPAVVTWRAMYMPWLLETQYMPWSLMTRASNVLYSLCTMYVHTSF